MRLKKHRQKYISGTYLREDDRSGFVTQRTFMTKEPITKLIVEPRFELIDNPVDRDQKGIRERRIRID